MNTDNSLINSTTDNNEQKEKEMNTDKVTLSLTSEQLVRLEQLAKKMNKGISETFRQIVDRGIYDVNYKYDRMVKSAKEYREFKEWKKANK